MEVKPKHKLDILTKKSILIFYKINDLGIKYTPVWRWYDKIDFLFVVIMNPGPGNRQKLSTLNQMAWIW